MKDAYAISRILLADVYDATAEPESVPAPPRQKLRRLALTLSTLLFAATHASPEHRRSPDEARSRLSEMTSTIEDCKDGGVFSPAVAARLHEMSDALHRILGAAPPAGAV